MLKSIITIIKMSEDLTSNERQYGIRGPKLTNQEVEAPPISKVEQVVKEKETEEILEELLTHITAESPHEAAGLSEDARLQKKTW